MSVFKEKGKPEYPEKNLSEQGREPTTNSTHLWFRHRDLNPDPIGGGECSYHCATQLSPAEWGDLDFNKQPTSYNEDADITKLVKENNRQETRGQL